jgi:zinc protease
MTRGDKGHRQENSLGHLRYLLLLAALSLSSCADRITGMAPTAVAPVPATGPSWSFETSDIPVDPGFRFGRLGNGMGYVIRRNRSPRGTALVRMEVAVGSLDEKDGEQGFAHFIEHMAFDGSTHVPEGEMVRLLERHGLAYGGDANAWTDFDRTTYMLDLPRNDPKLLKLALMLFRETASELTISPEAVARERGVVLAEMRDRNSWQRRNSMSQARFLHPHARYPRRFSIGTTATLEAATAETLRAFWRREYTPAKITIVVIGDFDPKLVEAAITAKFADWRPAPAPPQPDPGPVEPDSAGRTAIYIDPALSEQITASRNGPWIDGPDTAAQRRENLLRKIGYGMINRRLQRVARQVDPPFRYAGFDTRDVFRTGRTTNLVVDTIDKQWRTGLIAAVAEYRRALTFGFSQIEMDEQIARIRADTENAVLSASTRNHATLMDSVFDLLRNRIVPSPPQSVLARLRAFIPKITPNTVIAALNREALPLIDPLLRFEGRNFPDGGETAIRAAWDEGMRQPIAPAASAPIPVFAYEDFGPVGTVESDGQEHPLGIRQVRFSNGVMLNIKRTDLETNRVDVQLSIDGGDMLNTRDNPLATQMVNVLPVGGLGKHSQDELQSILAGHKIDLNITDAAETFVSSAQTTPRDLGLQLRVLAALITDPGFRLQGEIQYRLNMNHFFNQLNPTPSAALSNNIGGILSDDDPRFTLQPVEAFRRLTFDRLKENIMDRFRYGAIEIAIVGDVDVKEAIALVASTFGALPPRERAFRPYTEQRARTFTADRKPHIVRHTGPRDQALLRLTWPTRDDSDPEETLALKLLERVVTIELTETLRRELGRAYSPEAASVPMPYWRNYGIFGVAASVDVTEVPATRAAVIATIAKLRTDGVSKDLLRRARQPLLEEQENTLKTNAGWMSLVGRAQTMPDRIDRYLTARHHLRAASSDEIQTLARRYLTDDGAVEVVVLPQGVETAALEPDSGS